MILCERYSFNGQLTLVGHYLAFGIDRDYIPENLIKHIAVDDRSRQEVSAKPERIESESKTEDTDATAGAGVSQSAEQLPPFVVDHRA